MQTVDVGVGISRTRQAEFVNRARCQKSNCIKMPKLKRMMTIIVSKSLAIKWAWNWEPSWFYYCLFVFFFLQSCSSFIWHVNVKPSMFFFLAIEWPQLSHIANAIMRSCYSAYSQDIQRRYSQRRQNEYHFFAVYERWIYAEEPWTFERAAA